MGSLTNSYENTLLNAMLGDGRAAGFPATVYLALFTTDPGEAGAGTEVTGGAYARQGIANTTTNWPNATGGTKSNAVAVTFPSASASWGTITHVGLMSALTGGLMVAYTAVSSPTPVASGETAVFPPGSLVFTAD